MKLKNFIVLSIVIVLTISIVVGQTNTIKDLPPNNVICWDKTKTNCNSFKDKNARGLIKRLYDLGYSATIEKTKEGFAIITNGKDDKSGDVY